MKGHENSENNDHQEAVTKMQDEVDVRSQVSKLSGVGCSRERNPWLSLRGSLRTFMAESFRPNIQSIITRITALPQ